YSTKDVSGCTNYLYCPFNTNYKKCVAGCEELNCAELGYTSENKTAWCTNVITCPNNITLTACVGQCVYNDICIDKIDEATASMPSQFAQLQFEDCTACGQTGQVVTGWKCNDGYKYITDAYNTTPTTSISCKNGICCIKCGSSYMSKSDATIANECYSECDSRDCVDCDMYGSNCGFCDACYEDCYRTTYVSCS
ncbi:MAG: hypothetical protein IJF12_05065, partial [Alphaproteobacteria bacterium]|nr:hypothetical protein [Alphaproteobacteria bacterium]